MVETFEFYKIRTLRSDDFLSSDSSTKWQNIKEQHWNQKRTRSSKDNVHKANE